jgi:membrane protein implicated in regulation of membrane protease activity
MQLDSAKALLAGLWILVMGVVTYLVNDSSLATWVALIGFTAIPIAAMWRFWSVPSQTMSESINEARRR